VGVCVRDTRKDCAILEQPLEASRYARTASIKKNAARLIDKPRQSRVCAAEDRHSGKMRAPPVTTTNAAAIRQANTDSVSSHPEMSCKAGSVNR